MTARTTDPYASRLSPRVGKVPGEWDVLGVMEAGGADAAELFTASGRKPFLWNVEGNPDQGYGIRPVNMS